MYPAGAVWIGATNHPAPAPFWLVLGSIALVLGVVYGVLWRRSADASSVRARRYRISSVGLLAWAAFCFARAATL